MADLIELLRETMILKDLSPEQASKFIGCSGRQVRRWLAKQSRPGLVQKNAIKQGIKKINIEIPGDTPEGLISWGAQHGRPTKVPKEEKIFGEQVQVFFDEICRKVGKVEREYILFNDDYLHGFQEILFLARKYKVKLPDLK